MSTDRFVVTGGAGFVGSHLCERLLADGAEVVALDNLSTGSADNLTGLRGPLSLIEADVRAPLDVPGRVTGVFHLACPASPPHYQADAVGTTLTAVLGTLHALELAVRHDVPVLIASTSEVYGDPEVHPQTEDYRGLVNPIGPRACYDEGKRCGESLAMDFARQRGAKVRIARIFNTYGPRMALDDGRVISNFVAQALRGEPLTLYGDGNQTRSFCYVDDLVDGLVRLQRHPAETGPVNLGNPVERSMLALVTALADVLGRELTITHQPLPIDDPRRRRPDITLAQRALGFSPQVDLAHGLRHTVAAFAQRLGVPA